MIQNLGMLLREELAMNPHNNDEAFNRCTCDDCVAAVSEPLAALYADLADAAKYLPIDVRIMPGGPVVGEIVVERFSKALHRLHVFVSAPAGRREGADA